VVSLQVLSLSHRFAIASLLSSGMIVGLGLTLLAYVRPQAIEQVGGVDLQPCDVPGIAGGAKCGTYNVYENRSTKTGRKLGLSIVVAPALNATPPDPVFWLEGGPGGSATEAAGIVSHKYLPDLRNDRDLVFVDQRGTGKSNPLRCDDIGESPANLDAYFGKLFSPDLMRACQEKLEKTADLKLYTTPIAMDDLDDVRSALGYKEINLAGISRCSRIRTGVSIVQYRPPITDKWPASLCQYSLSSFNAKASGNRQSTPLTSAAGPRNFPWSLFLQ